MPDTNEQLNKFKQIVMSEAAHERDTLLQQAEEERRSRLSEAEARIKQETDAYTQSRASAISSETGREISKRMLENKRVIAAHREEIAQAVFADVREKLSDFTETEAYLPHLKQLFTDAYDILGNPDDGITYLRSQDMSFADALAALRPELHMQFETGRFLLGGLIVESRTKKQRVDQCYDTALDDLNGHFAELFGLSLAD